MGQLDIERSGKLGQLDSRIATPLALVITELIHNALEHGLAESGSKLNIELNRSANLATITIADDGVGLPQGFSLAQSSNLGLQIVRTLTENELRGEIVLENSNRGTQARLNFPL
jgi:two-component sensor histidine kinase